MCFKNSIDLTCLFRNILAENAKTEIHQTALQIFVSS